jgi:hypothetical protein
MKAEHKKALETNVLADRLGKAIEGVKHGPSRSTVVYGVVLVVAVLVVGLIYRLMSDSEQNTAERWTKLDSAVFAAQIDDIADGKQLKDTPQGRMARFLQARYNLSEGLRKLGAPETREQSLGQIEKAAEAYEQLARSSDRVPLLRQEALWGAAKGNEALGTTESLEKARGFYKELADKYPASELGKDAIKQLERLDGATKRELDTLRQLTEARGK